MARRAERRADQVRADRRRVLLKARAAGEGRSAKASSDWYASLESDARFHFCRFTQLGFLRLLTAEAVMGDDVLKQPEAWAVYDRWLEDGRTPARQRRLS